jgi:hypothetical protein
MVQNEQLEQLITSASLPGAIGELEAMVRDGITKSGALRIVDALGANTSSQQFDEFFRRGLFEAPDEKGRYPADTVDRLLRIHDLGKTPGYFTLARRVLLLRSEPAFWYIPWENVQAAMVEVAETMHAPIRKMRRVEKALTVWASYPAQSALFANGPGVPIEWRVPEPNSWLKVLTRDGELFRNRYGFQYGTAMNVLPMFIRGTSADLGDIPLEEQVALLTVRDLAALQEMRRLAEDAEKRRREEEEKRAPIADSNKGSLLAQALEEKRRQERQSSKS